MILRLFILLLNLCALLIVSQRNKPYNNFKLVEILNGGFYRWEELFEDINLDVLDERDQSLTVMADDGDMRRLQEVATRYNLTINVLQENLQLFIDQIFRDMDKHRAKRQATNLKSSIKQFLNLPKSYAYHTNVVRSCSRRLKVTKRTIGYSFEKRPINVLQVSTKKYNPRRKTIFIEAGIHAREWLSPATANYIIYQLACVRANEYLTYLFNWEILPILNPDGYAFTHSGSRMWRKNRQPNARSRCVGTDLNRNFKAGYGKRGASSNPCSSTYRGAVAASAPETKVLTNYIMRNKGKIISYLSLHTYGQYIIIPWDYKRDRIPDYNKLKSIAQKTASATGYRFKIQTGYSMYPAAGTSNDFMRERAGVARTFTWELMPTGSPGFAPKEALIPRYTSAIWKGVKSFAAAVSRDATTSGVTLG